MKKVFVVCNFYSGGGTEQIALHLLDAIAAWGHEPTLVAFVKRGDFVRRIPDHVRVPDLGVGKRTRFRRDFFRDVRALRRLIQRERPDLIMSIIMHENVKTVLSCCLSGLKVRTVLIEQTSIEGWVRAELPRWWLWQRLIRFAYNRADAVVTASRGIQHELESMGVPPGRITTIYNPVPIDHVRRLGRFPADLPASNGEPVLIAVGGLRKQKGYPYLFQAFERVVRDTPCHLLVLGSGPDLPALQSLARSLDLEERIHFLGFQENPYAFMARSDVFVLSSLWEGFGIVIIEAMACGLPVVVTDCPEGPGEIVSDGIDGLLVPVADDVAMTHAILRMLKSRILREALVENAGVRVRDFASSRILEQYRNLVLGWLS